MTRRGRKLISLDTCAVMRLWNAPTSPTIVAQAAGVREILRCLHAGEHAFVGTWALWFEIEQTPNVDIRVAAFNALPDPLVYVSLNDAMYAQAGRFTGWGLSGLDAIHVALALRANADLLFTTDRRMLKFGERHSSDLAGLEIVDPVHWREWI